MPKTDLEGYEHVPEVGDKDCQWTAKESRIADGYGEAAVAEPESLRTFGWGSTWPS